MIDKDVINRVLRDFPMFYYKAAANSFEYPFCGYGSGNGCAYAAYTPLSGKWVAALTLGPLLEYPNFVPAEFDLPEQALGYLLLQGVIP